jgi:hypothetical protein
VVGWTGKNFVELLSLLVSYPVARFAGVKGSYIFNGFESGKMIYLSYVLRKTQV